MHKIKQSILADALETIDEAIAIYDPDDRLIAFNHKYEMLRSAIGGKIRETVKNPAVRADIE